MFWLYNPRWLRILLITAGSSIAARSINAPGTNEWSARVGNPRWLRILLITAGSSIAARSINAPGTNEWSARVGNPRLALLSGLRIRCGCELWCRLQTRLGSGIAVALAQAGGYSSDSTPSLGTSICCGCGPRKDKKQTNKKNFWKEHIVQILG